MATITIPAGVTSTGLIIEAGDILNIQSGGTATNTTENGGAVNVADGGFVDFAANTITGLTVGNAAMTVHQNTVANENVFGAGGSLRVYDGGIASGNMLNVGNGNVDIYSGGKVYGTTASVGEGHFTVYDGGYAENTVFNCHWRWGSGLSVMMNATVTGTTVFGDGRMSINEGAVANNTLMAGGSVAAAGTVNGFTATAGTFNLNSNGTAKDINLTNATMNVNDGAVASGLVVTSRATVNITSGGTLDGLTEVGLYNTVNVSTGGAVETFKETGGAVYVAEGGTASFAESLITGQTVDNYVMTVHQNTVANDNVFGAGGSLRVYDGGIASGNMLNVGNGNVDVYEGGKIYGTTASVGEGHFTVSAGGYAENTVFACHWRWGSGLSVMMNATVTGTTVFGDGRMSINEGSVANNTLMAGGSVAAAGTVNGFTATAGTFNLNSNGTAKDINLTNATMNVNDGAVASGLVVTSRATVNITSGGTLDGLTEVGLYNTVNVSTGGAVETFKETGGAVYVAEGGTASFAESLITGQTVDNYVMTVHKNTVANDNVFGAGGSLRVYDGGIASGNMLNVGNGNVDIYSGGKVYGTTASVGEGHFTVYDGGYAENTVFACHWRWGSGLTVMMNATVTGTTVFGDGRMSINEGAVANNTLQVGGAVNVNGLAAGITVRAGGTYVLSGGTATDANVESTGRLEVREGGALTGATVHAGSMYVSSGAVAEGIVENGGYVTFAEGATVSFAANVISGATITGRETTLHSGTTATEVTYDAAGVRVYNGGIMDKDQLLNSTWVAVSEGGLISGATFGWRAYAHISSGGSGENLLMSAGSARAYVSSGGSVTGATVAAGAWMDVLTGGLAAGGDIDSGGVIYVYTGGVASGANVNADGALRFYQSGASADGATVNLHGTLVVIGGGTATNIKENGGYVEIAEDATATFVSNHITGATMGNGRTMTLHSGTTATDVGMEGSGWIRVYEGGVLENTTLNYSGYAHVSGGFATGMTMNGGGATYLFSGGTATDATILGGAVNISSGGLLTGKVDIDSGNVWIGEGGTFLIDLTDRAPKSAAEVSGANRISGTKTITVKVSDTQENGKYLLSSNVTGFDGAISVVGSDGTALGLLHVNETVNIGGVDYSLAVSSKTLKLFIGIDVIPGDLYVNPQWDDLIEGSTVTLLNGGKAIYGFDAFSNVDDAVAVMDKDDGTLNIEGGTFAFATQVAQMNVSRGVNVTLQSGTVIGSAEAQSGGKINIEDGAVVTVMENGGFVEVASGATVAFVPNYMSGLYVSGSYNSASFHSGTSAGWVNPYWYGLVRIEDGAEVSSAYVADSGSLIVGSGGFVDFAYVSSGTLTMMPGARIPLVSAPYYGQVVLSGGTVGELAVSSSTILNVTLTPELNVSGAVAGALFTISDGVAKGLRLNWYSLLDVSDGCTADRVVLSGYSATARIRNGGSGSKINVSSGGILNVLDGGLMQSAAVYGSGSMYVSSGGRAEAIALNGSGGWAYGYLSVLTGGTATGVAVSSGGYVWTEEASLVEDMTLLEGGQAYLRGSGGGAVVESGAYLGIEAGGAVAGATVAGSMYTVDSAGIGSALEARIQSGGHFYNGGYASNTQVLSGGVMTNGYGLADATTVQSGGLLALGGGTVHGLSLESGATLTADYGGLLTGTITVADGAVVSGESLSVVFDLRSLAEPAATPFVNNYTALAGSVSSSLYLFVSADQAAGTYLLADGVGSDFGKYIEVYNPETWDYLGTLTLNSIVAIAGVNYQMTLDNGTLAVAVGVVNPEEVYVNSEWSDLPKGASVTPVAGGTTATIGYDAFANVEEAFAAVAEDGEVQVVGGSVSFDEPVTQSVAIDEGATLTGRADFETSAAVNGEVRFETALSVVAPQFTGLENVAFGDNASFSLVFNGGIDVGESLLLATGASALNGRSVDVGGLAMTIGSDDGIADGGIAAGLELVNDSGLVLSVVTFDNGSDDGWNNTLWDKAAKRPTGVYYDPAVVVTQNTSSVTLDRKFSVSSKLNPYSGAFHNFVGNDGTADAADYRKIHLDTGAMLTFEVSGEAKGKFVIYQIEETLKGGAVTYKLKALSTIATSVPKGAAEYDLRSKKPVYLEAGDYFLAMEGALNKKGETSGFYNVSIDQSGSKFYLDDDNGDNNWLYDSKAKVWNPLVAGSAPLVLDSEDVGEFIRLDDEMPTQKAGWENFVGFGDAMDVRKIRLDSAANLSFDVSFTGGAAKFHIYSVDAKGKLKDAATALKPGVPTKAVLLEAGTYYIAVESTKAGKGEEVYYNVKVNSKSVFFEDGDSNANNLDPKTKMVSALVRSHVEDIALGALRIDGALPTDAGQIINHDGKTNFVGYGDATDMLKINASAGDFVSLRIEATDAVNLAVYGTQANGKLKALKTVKLAAAGSATLDYAFQAKDGFEFFVGVEAKNAKKGEAAWYNVEVLSFSGAADALAMPETDSLALPDSLSLGQCDADVLAGTALDSAADRLPGESSWSLLASL